MHDVITVKINGVWVQRRPTGISGSDGEYTFEPAAESDTEHILALQDMESRRNKRGGRKQKRRRKKNRHNPEDDEW